MASFGENIGTPSGGFYLSVDYSFTQNTAGNYSLLNVTSKVKKNNSSYKPWNSYGKTAWIKIERQTDSGAWATVQTLSNNSGYDMRSATTITLVSASGIKIAHKSNGEQSIRITAYVDGQLSSYYPIGQAQSTIKITTIPRATTPSLTPATVTMGESIAISLPRASSGFTHTLQHDLCVGSWTTFATGATTSAVLEVPTEWISRLPNAVQGNGKIRCLTYSGETLIGEKTVGFTAKIPDDVIPTVDTISIFEATAGIAEKFGAFLQNKSQLRVVSSASGVQGSTISSYMVEVQGISYSGAEITTYVITRSGNVDVKVTATDTRGRKNSKTVQVTLVEYFIPTITTFDAYRADVSGNEASGSKTLKCVYDFTIASCGEKNDKNYKIEYKRDKDTEWTTLVSGSLYAMNTSYMKDDILELEYSYDVRLTVTDYFNPPATYQTKVGTEVVPLCVYPTGKGLGIGGYPTGELLQVFMGAEFYKTLKLMDVDENGANIDLLDRLTEIANELSRINNKLDADYIVEQGIIAGWRYRKWNSGTMEAWNHPGNSTVTLTAKYNSFYYKSITWRTLPGFKEFESGSVNVYANDNNGLWFGAIRKATIADDGYLTVIFYVAQPLTAAMETEVIVQPKMHLIGTWK